MTWYACINKRQSERSEYECSERSEYESYKDRDTVMRAARKEKPRGVFVNEDLSQRVMARRRELMPRLREARQQGKIAYLSYDRLVVRDRVERT